MNRPPDLSLPKGGGAIRGIGEKFSASPATGTYSFSVPVALSPARAGFELRLDLSYDSGNGNGPFGIGWRLSLPFVSRKTDKGLPRYGDAEESDTFILSGAEDLVPARVPEGSGTRLEIFDRVGFRIKRYRPRIEALFARIEQWTDKTSGDIHWRAVTRDNVTQIFGKNPQARIADPENPSRVFTWLLEEKRDDRGNIARFIYKAEDDAGVDFSKPSETARFEITADGRRSFRPGSQRYLKRIQYGNRRPDDPSDWLFEAVLDYGEHDRDAPAAGEAKPWPVRRDAFSTYRAGFEVRTYRLCRRILFFHNFPELDPAPCLVRSMDFQYAESPVIAYLTAITTCGYKRNAETGTYRCASLPPLDLEYTRPEIHDKLTALNKESFEGIPGGTDGSGSQWIDLDGEGIPGVLTVSASAWRYKANLGGGKLAPAELLPRLPAPAELGGANQQLIDLAGDGRLDLVDHSPPLQGYFTRTTDGTWAPFKTFQSVPNINWQDPNLRFLDLDGDGLADVLLTEDEVFVWFRSRGKEGFESAAVVTKPKDENSGPTVVFADGAETIQLADMNGDGLTDIVRIRNGEVCYWPNLGYGRFGRKVAMDGSPRFDTPDQFNPQRICFADVDGSGASDVFYMGREGATLWFNQCGNGWSDPEKIRSFPAADSLSNVGVADLLGQGTACLVWSSPLPADAQAPLAYIDLMGGVKPHLLVKVTNNLGAETALRYASSTKFYLADKLAGRPWITRLPFPVQVVERVEIYDRLSRNRFVTRYAYHHGFFDGAEREFRGFGMVEQWDTEEFAALGADGAFPAGDNIDAASHVPPVLTKTWFHTGVHLDGRRVSRQFETEYYRESGSPAPLPDSTDTQPRAMLLDDTILPDGLSPDETAEACRALRGSILRQEIYGLDCTENENRPYKVSERNYTVKRLQTRDHSRHAVFFAHPRETVDFQYERKLYEIDGGKLADPRVSHTLTLEVDRFGNVLKSVAVGYGRRRNDSDPFLSAADQDKQKRARVVYTENRYTDPVLEDDAYRTPLPCETRTYEIVNMTPDADDPLVTNLFRFDETARKTRSAGDGGRDLPYEDFDAAGATTGSPYRRLIEHVRTRFRSNDLSELLPLGQLQSLALPGESCKLALTPGLTANVFGSRVTDAVFNEGGYVHSEGDDNWWIPSGRVFYSPNNEDTPAQELTVAQGHFFLPRRFCDPFGESAGADYDDHDLLPVRTIDPMGNTITVENDCRVLLPRLVTDSNGNRAEVAFDALGMVVGTAVMGKAGESLGDSLAGFNADPDETLLLGHIQNPLADPHAVLFNATTRLIYDLFAYGRTRTDPQPQPAVVYTMARETHAADLSPGIQTKVQHGFSYSDGFGREIQRKAQAEAGPLIESGPESGPRWMGSGWTIFNNKGKPVRRHEPFFSATPAFEFAKTVGVSSTLFYDPVERVVGTLHPNHTWEKVVFDPWRQETWDVNDTVLLDPRNDPVVGSFLGRLPDAEYLPAWHGQRAGGGLGVQERIAADKAAVHASTPTIVCFDALGRPFLTVSHNKFMREDSVVEEKLATRLILDIQSNQREVIDAQGRIVMRYDIDMLGNRIRQSSMEAGERRMLSDVAGQSLRAWDGRGHVFRAEYDELRRPLASFVRGADPSDLNREILYERLLYGDSPAAGLTDNQILHSNLRGRIYKRFDGAGASANEAYDFKGNLLGTVRQLAADYKTVPDWSTDPLLESKIFLRATSYDALNRPTALTSPDGSVIDLIYNEANLLERIEGRLRGSAAVTSFVNDIDYNARGQRTSITYGNGVKTIYSYDPLSFRLTRLQTLRGTERLQDLTYTYDPAGNITYILDDAQQTIFFRNRRVDPSAEYTYDAVYRLIEAVGREHLGQASAGGPLPPAAAGFADTPRAGLPHPGDGNAMGVYRQRYVYDETGNILEMIHRGTDPANSGWTRLYGYTEPSLLEAGKTNNRLTRTQSGEEPPETYACDAHGNMTSMPHLPMMAWSFKDQLRASSRQVRADGGTPEITYYAYDGDGRRVRKVTERQAAPGEAPTRFKEHLCLDRFEAYREYSGNGNTVTLERETLQVLDGVRQAPKNHPEETKSNDGQSSEGNETPSERKEDIRRLAMVETRILGGGSSAQLIRFQFADHLGSSSLELNAEAQIISYEEFYPYGSTSFQAVNGMIEADPKRYRFAGMERDEETGLNHHGARYYAPWLARWTSADPAGVIDGANLYCYVRNNPVGHVDPDGLAYRLTRPPQGVRGRLTITAEEEAAFAERFIQSNRETMGWEVRYENSRLFFADVTAAYTRLRELEAGIRQTFGPAQARQAELAITELREYFETLLPGEMGAEHNIGGEVFHTRQVNIRLQVLGIFGNPQVVSGVTRGRRVDDRREEIQIRLNPRSRTIREGFQFMTRTGERRPHLDPASGLVMIIIHERLHVARNWLHPVENPVRPDLPPPPDILIRRLNLLQRGLGLPQREAIYSYRCTPFGGPGAFCLSWEGGIMVYRH